MSIAARTSRTTRKPAGVPSNGRTPTVAAGASIAVPTTQTIDCQRIVLRDSAGRPRIELGISPAGSAEIVLRSSRGKVRARVHVDKDGVAGFETSTSAGACGASVVSMDGDDPGAAAIVRSPGRSGDGVVALTASQKNGPSCDITGEHDDVEDFEIEEIGITDRDQEESTTRPLFAFFNDDGSRKGA